MTYTDIFTRLFRTHSTWDRTSLVLNPCPLLCQGHPCFLSVGIPPRTYCVTISVGQSCLKAFFSDFNAVDKLNEMQIFIANIIWANHWWRNLRTFEQVTIQSSYTHKQSLGPNIKRNWVNNNLFWYDKSFCKCQMNQ